MFGITVFKSIEEAWRAGFEIYDKKKWGCVVRRKTLQGWEMAEVRFEQEYQEYTD